MAKTKIDYDTVVAATSGDALAAGAVLDYFNDFMDGLCTGSTPTRTASGTTASTSR